MVRSRSVYVRGENLECKPVSVFSTLLWAPVKAKESEFPE